MLEWHRSPVGRSDLDQGDFLGPEAVSLAGDIAADVSGPDDDHLFADLHRFLALGFLQEIQGGDDLFVAREVQPPRLVGPDRDHDVVELILEFLEFRTGHVSLVMDMYPGHGQESLDLLALGIEYGAAPAQAGKGAALVLQDNALADLAARRGGERWMEPAISSFVTPARWARFWSTSTFALTNATGPYARKLAGLFRADELTAVRVPTLEEEAVRDLLRARQDEREDKAARLPGGGPLGGLVSSYP